jgi:hypothetical protein
MSGAAPPMLDVALALADRFPVLPLWWPENGGCPCGKETCDDVGKHPIEELVEHGVSQATTDPVLIRRWLQKFPEMNIGVRVGERRVVLDFDSPEALARFEAELPEPLPVTLMVQTGRGVHVWLALPEGAAIRSGHDVLGKNIDIKTGNSYVVAPPSRHRSGRTYFYISKPDAPIAPCPAWLLKRLSRPQACNNGQEHAPGLNHADIMRGVPESGRDGFAGRDDASWKLARSCRALGYPKSDAMELNLLFAARCTPPFPVMDAAEKVERAYARPEKEARAALAKEGTAGAAEPEAATTPAGHGGSEPDSGRHARQILTLADWMEKPAPPVRYLMDRLIPDESITATIGRPYGGKSLSAFARDLCLAAGIPWLDFTTRPDGIVVLYVDEEQGRALMEARFLRMRAAHEALRSGATWRRFHVASRIGYRLDSKEWREALREDVGRLGVKKLTIDTLRRVHSGNEDRSEEMAALFGFLSDLRREFGLTSEVIHHTKKNPNEDGNWMDAARGSGDIVAATDGLMGIWKIEDGIFTFRADTKAGGEVEPRDLLLNPETLWFGPAPEGAAREAVKESAVQEAKSRICKTLRKLKERGRLDAYPPSWNELATAAKGNADTLRTARTSLEREGVIAGAKRTAKGGGTFWLFAEDLDEWNRSGSASGSASDEGERN